MDDVEKILVIQQNIIKAMAEAIDTLTRVVQELVDDVAKLKGEK